MKLKYTLAAFAALTVSANAATIYSSDFQGDAIGATPADWSGNIRVFSGAGATTEGGTNDRAIIALTGTDMSAILDLGQVGVIGDTISVNLDVAQYASSGTSVVTYSLGTVTGGGVFTAFAEAAVTEATSGARSGSRGSQAISVQRPRDAGLLAGRNGRTARASTTARNH